MDYRNLDTRQILLGLHVITVIVAFSGGVYSCSISVTQQDVDGMPMNWYYFQALNALVPSFVGLVTVSILLIVGIFSPHLHQESSMVVNSCLLLWFLQIPSFIRCLGGSFYNPGGGCQKLLYCSPGSIAVHVILLLLYSAQLLLSSHSLRSRGSPWPRAHLLQFFTLETPIVIFRLANSSICLSILMRFNTIQEPSGAIYFTILTVAALSLVASLEATLTLYWGVTHKKTLGVGSVLCSVGLAIVPIVTLFITSLNIYMRDDLLSWFSVAAVLTFLHGVLCLAKPKLLSTPPAIFFTLSARDGESMAARGAAVTSGQRRASATNVDSPAIYNRMLDNDGVEQEEAGVVAADDAVVAADEEQKMTVLELFKLSPSFLRNVIYVALSLIILGLDWHYLVQVLHSDSYYYYYRSDLWAPALLLCTSTCLLLRTAPALAVQLYTRTRTAVADADTPPVQLAGHVLLEAILSIVGILGTFIDVHAPDLRPYAIVAAVAAMLIITAQVLEVNGAVRALKREGTASS